MFPLELSILLNNQPLKCVPHFTYLGSTVSSDNSLDKELNKRVSAAAASFSRLHHRVWSQRGIKTSTKCKVSNSTPKKLHSSLLSHKDKQDPSSRASSSRIPCECSKFYFGETGCNLSTRLKEHQGHERKRDFEKSAIVKHLSNIPNHQLDQVLQNSLLLSTWHPSRIREAIEILQDDTVPQDIDFHIRDIWLSLFLTTGSPISMVRSPAH